MSPARRTTCSVLLNASALRTATKKSRLCASIAILDWRASQRGEDDVYLANRVLAGEGSPQHFLKRLRALPRDRALAVFRESSGMTG